MKNTKMILGSLLVLLTTSCNYSNTFTGTFNGATATMNAYSGNINRYCITLSLASNGVTTPGFISAQLVFDENDFLATKSFNTKGTQCNANMKYYLSGTRSVEVKSTSEVRTTENVNSNYCRTVFYKSYRYQETIALEHHDLANDLITGSFLGKGLLEDYIDTSHPVRYGQIYFCGVRPYPGYPRDPRNPNYPRPYPGYPGYPGYPYPSN